MSNVATNGGATSRRRLSLDRFRRSLDNALLEMERMDGGEQTHLSKDAEGEYGKDLTGEGLSHIHIHLEGSTAPAGKTRGITTGGSGEGGTNDDFPSGPEFPENPNAGNDPNRMRGQDDPTEMRFQRIEQALSAILQALGGGQGGGEQGPGPQMGHGEPDGDEPGSAQQAPGASGRFPENDEAMGEEEAQEFANEVNDSLPEERMTKDKAMRVRDSQKLEVSYRSLMADCEILVPGMQVPTYDSATHPVDTILTMCNTRKKALDLAYMSQGGKAAIDQVMRGKFFDSSVMDCSCIRRTFDAAVAVARAVNNAPVMRTVDSMGGAPMLAPNGFIQVGTSKIRSVKT